MQTRLASEHCRPRQKNLSPARARLTMTRRIANRHIQLQGFIFQLKQVQLFLLSLRHLGKL